MSIMQAEVTITLKQGIFDPQSKTAHQAINTLGWNNVKNISYKKQFVIACEVEDEKQLQKQVNDICKKLLVNEVTENYVIRLIESS